jgi:hypothetical protein
LTSPLEDYPSALRRALEHPIGQTRLESLVGPGKRVAIVVDDPSRWTPVREALPIVIERLRKLGVSNADISVSVGIGRHRALDPADLRRRLGDETVENHACHSPPLDELSQYVDLGTTSANVPVRVFRPVAEADVRVLIGSVLPHLQAGFGGGFKLIFPGCSHRSTLGALHRQGLGDNPHQAAKLLGSDVRGNPMRAAIREAAALLPGHCFSVSHLLGAGGDVLEVFAGDVDFVQHSLSVGAARRFRVDCSNGTADLVVVGNFPWPGDPLMSFKVLLNHRAALRQRGVLAGFFWTDPDELDRSLPMGVLRTISATGPLGGWVIQHGLRNAERLTSWFKHPSRFMIRWARELVADQSVFVYSPELSQRFGRMLGPVRLFSAPEDLWKQAQQELRHPPELALVMPIGGLSYVANNSSEAT